MPAWKPLPEFINGFKVIEDLGYIKETWKNKKTNEIISHNARTAKFLCTVCPKIFIAKISKMKIRKSCGCRENGCKDLPKEINGFKIIKDLGMKVHKNNRKGKRERCLIAICKKCNIEFESTPPHLRRNDFGCSAKCSLGKGGNKRLGKIRESMIARCHNKNHVSYSNYSQNEITVCDEWFYDSTSFYVWALSNGYQDDLTLDRIDNSKGYFPENCRWSDKHIQAQNSSQAKLTIDKVKQILKLSKLMRQDDIAKIYNVTPSTINGIINGTKWKNVNREGL